MKRFLGLVALALFLSGLGWMALPRLIEAVPGQYRHRLPRPLLELVLLPLPTALPAPVVSVVEPRITIPVFAQTQNETSATARPTVTAVPPSPESDRDLAATIPATWTPSPSVTPQPTSTRLPTPTLIPTNTPLPSAFQLSGLQNVPQKFNNCGPANLSASLNYYGHPVSQLDIAAVLRPGADDRNVSPEELASYVNDNTPLRAMHLSGGDLDLLKRLVLAGFPVIIEKGLKPSEWEGWMGHYLTIYGYDDGLEAFYSLDTYLGPWDGSGRTDSYSEIDRQWAHFNRTFLVIYPRTQQTMIDEILGPAMQDPAAMWQKAALQAQRETELTPDSAFPWFNLGTNLTHLAEILDQPELYASAAIAFDQSRNIGLPARMLWYQFEPYVAYLAAGRIEEVILLSDATLAYPGGRDVEETYLHRGHALLAMGDTAGAAVAYRRALDLNPNFSLAQQALSALD